MITSKKTTIIAELKILPGFENELRTAAKTVWEATRKESGCEAFIFNSKQNDENTIVFLEIFTSEEDFEIHKTETHTIAFLETIKGKVLNDGPELTFLTQYID